MSLEYPCIYHYGNGLCGYGGKEMANICVLSPCPHETPSNGDRIRAMSDEELAKRIWPRFGCPNGKNHVTCGYVGDCKDCWMEWLQQPAKEDT